MKKIQLLIVAMCYLVCACTSQDEPIMAKQQVTEGLISEIYDIEEAITFANDIAEQLDLSTSRATPRTASKNNVVEYKTTKSRTENTQFYVVNYEENQGYAIIAKKRIANPVVAVINEGNYSEGEIIDNPGFNMFMDVTSSIIERDTTIKPIDWEWKPGDGPIPAIQFKTERDTLEHLLISPKTINFFWGQERPEGLLCPNGLSGCANTALFMVMAYFHTPSAIAYTYEGATMTRETLNWTNIAQHIYRYDNCTQSVHNTISRVCRQLGQLTNSTYYPQTSNQKRSTSTARKKMATVAKNILSGKTVSELKSYTDFYDFYDILPDLETGLVIMAGEVYNKESGKNVDMKKGHAWVVDGCKYYYVRVKTYKKEYNDLSWVLQSTKLETTPFLSINWGWEGSQNGYFYWNNFNPKVEDVENPIFLDIQYIVIK